MTNKIDDGGPAFPGEHTTGMCTMSADGRVEQMRDAHQGMSLRDWFAGQAACALGSALNTVEGRKLLIKASSEHDASPAKLIAVTAYQIADAMLAARKVQP